MLTPQTAELILTPDGIIPNIVFVEELIAAAPEIAGWKFTALKPESDIHQVGINMHGYEFNQQTLSFYFNQQAEYPDEIDLVVVHDALYTTNFTEPLSYQDSAFLKLPKFP